ncbi:MAG: DUF4266 domain-containing protein [Burkholderiales bacterium]|jgi:hypothetical protein
MTARLLLLLAIGGAGAGYSGPVTVQAWEKGELARPEMRFDAGSLESRMSEQVYPSKEGSSGGTGVGGGGCGCN